MQLLIMSFTIPSSLSDFSPFFGEIMLCAFSQAYWPISMIHKRRKERLGWRDGLNGLGNLRAFPSFLVKVDNSAASQFTW